MLINIFNNKLLNSNNNHLLLQRQKIGLNKTNGLTFINVNKISTDHSRITKDIGFKISTIHGMSEILKEIHSDFSEAQAIDIRGVAYFVFDRQYVVSGAQEETVFKNVIQEILKERV